MMRKLAVCYPGDMATVFMAAFASMVNIRPPAGCDVQWFQGTGWCQARRRTQACEKALAWGADLIVQLDVDQVYEPDVLERLVARHDEGYEMVAAMVPGRGYVEPSKVPPFGRLGWKLNPTRTAFEWIDPSSGEVVEEAEFPTSACVLYPAAALKQLPLPWYYFKFDPLTQRVIEGEDANFFLRLAQLGFKAWVDKSIMVKHCHVFAIDETYSERFADWAEHGKGDPAICQYSSPAAKVAA